MADFFLPPNHFDEFRIIIFAFMLTKDEKDFVEYWETHREKENSLSRKLLLGFQWGLLFALPILIVTLFNGWYKGMSPITTGQMVLILICVFAIAIFYAYFRQQGKWEQSEQLYKELKIKEQGDHKE